MNIHAVEGGSREMESYKLIGVVLNQEPKFVDVAWQINVIVQVGT